MSEPVITIIAGVSTIVTNVWSISKNLYELIDGINNAPRHIRAISEDVQGLYVVLGSLQGLLRNLDADGLPEELVPIFQSLHQNLDNCFLAFIELLQKINKYTKPSGEVNRSKWAGFWWQFTEKETREIRGNLAAYKLTVNLALATANLANSSQNLYASKSLEAEMREMRVHLEGLTETNEEELGGSVNADNGSCVSRDTDRHYALRRFLTTTESVFSSSPPPFPKLSTVRDEGMLPRPPPIPPTPQTPYCYPGWDTSQLSSDTDPDCSDDESTASNMPRGSRAPMGAPYVRVGRRKDMSCGSTDTRVELTPVASNHMPRHTDSDLILGRHLTLRQKFASNIKNRPFQSPDSSLTPIEEGRSGPNQDISKNKNKEQCLNARIILPEATGEDILDDVEVAVPEAHQRQDKDTSKSAMRKRSLAEGMLPNVAASGFFGGVKATPWGSSNMDRQEPTRFAESRIPPLPAPTISGSIEVKGDKYERRRKHASGCQSHNVSNSENHTKSIKSSRRRSSRSHGDESPVSKGEMGQVTESRLSADQRYFRSDYSKSSIDNPKLHETVEDAIRQLILPELTALKKAKAMARKAQLDAMRVIAEEKEQVLDQGMTGFPLETRVDYLPTTVMNEGKQNDDMDLQKVPLVQTPVEPGEPYVGLGSGAEPALSAMHGTEHILSYDGIHATTSKNKGNVPNVLDACPVTISGKKHDKDGKSLTQMNNRSQTSLLIEYFEGGKGHLAGSPPSVRVKVKPSSKRSSRSTSEHIQIMETKGTRKRSYTKRTNLSKDKNVEAEDDNKIVNSFVSATEESNVSRYPIEIEIMPRKHGSPLVPTAKGTPREVRMQPPGSDVSSIPAYPFLDLKPISLERKRSRSLTRAEAISAGAMADLAGGAIADTLHTPSPRSLSRARILAIKKARLRRETINLTHKVECERSTMLFTNKFNFRERYARGSRAPTAASPQRLIELERKD